MCHTKHIITNKLPESERPYEKCEKQGASHLTDAELLAVIIRSGTRSKRAVELAAELLLASPDKSLLGLQKLSLPQLQSISGIGRVKAIQIQCALELAKRMMRNNKGSRPCFRSPKEVADYYMQFLRADMTEKVFMLVLDTKCHLIKEIALSSGSFNASLMAPREVFYEALRHGAVSIILVHNHPSGDPAPSSSDIVTTERICETGKLVGVPLADHVIIGDNCYVSMREAGLIEGLDN